ncbi:hypothetical protein EPN95_03825 [Patescibacteria group bacterium]|nr:MAG: hypothetical protein EPN95_03825 [Patescibacteria group bacterium]
MDIQPVGLPVHDSIVAERTAKLTVEMQPTEPTLSPEAKSELGHSAMRSLEPRQVLLTPSEFSFAVQPFITEINNAKLDGKRTILGQTFMNYAQSHLTYIPAHEQVRFLNAVRKL